MNPEVERRTTNAFQLALPVIFLSGIEHIVETPDGMERQPEYVRQFLRDLPVVWDESRVVQGEPGKLAVFARRKGDTWYLAGINGEEQPKELSLDLSFIDGLRGTMIRDGEEPRSYRRESVTASASTQIPVKAEGGFVMVFKR